MIPAYAVLFFTHKPSTENWILLPGISLLAWFLKLSRYRKPRDLKYLLLERENLNLMPEPQHEIAHSYLASIDPGNPGEMAWYGRVT